MLIETGRRTYQLVCPQLQRPHVTGLACKALMACPRSGSSRCLQTGIDVIISFTVHTQSSETIDMMSSVCTGSDILQ